MTNDAILIYRSRTEQNMDIFMQNTGWPWLYSNRLWILLAVAVVGLSFWAFLKYHERNR